MSNETACTRSDLIESVYKSSQNNNNGQLTRVDATALFDSFLEQVVALLQESGEVKVAKFGIFSVKEKAARMGRNPKTGTSVEIAAHKAISFKPSSVLKAAVETPNASQKAA